MLAKLKNVVGMRRARYFTMGTLMAALLSFGAFAAEGDFNLATTMSAAVQTCVNDILGMIAAVLPIGITVLAVSVGIAYGTKFIKKIMKA